MTEPTSPTRPGFAWQRADGWLILALIVAIGLVYADVLSHQFVAWDDDSYVSKNARVFQGLTLDNLRWALTATAVSNWHPLTWWSYFADAAMWGQWAGGFALSNVILHALNSVLLFAVLRAATGERWRPVLVAALFALHPMHVESVAWVAERKDVLCALFWLLTMAAYLRYARRGGVAAYLLVSLGMALAMMAKPMAIMLPAALLCLDLWPLGRLPVGSPADTVRGLRRLIAEKLPWFGMAFALVLLTVAAQSHAVVFDYRASLRFLTVVNGYGAYLWHTLWPVDLHFYYLTEYIQSPLVAVFSSVALLVISGFAWRVRNSRPVVLAGWLWFLVTLLPVIGIVKTGTQAYADRYHYLPSIGLFCLLLWGVPWTRLVGGLRRPARGLAAVALLVLAGCAALTVRQVATWRDSETMFRHALAIEPKHYVALLGLARVRLEQGRFDEATALAGQAEPLSQSPAVRGSANRIRGNIAAKRGDHAESLGHYANALAAEPDNVENHFSYGTALLLLGDYPAAEAALRHALTMVPEYGDGWLNLGAVLSRQGRFAEALAAHRRAMPLLRPDRRLRLIYTQRLIDAGQLGEAASLLKTLAAEIGPDSPDRGWLARLQLAAGSGGGLR